MRETPQGVTTPCGGRDDPEDGAERDAASCRRFRVKVEMP